jgi:hypothetical protein
MRFLSLLHCGFSPRKADDHRPTSWPKEALPLAQLVALGADAHALLPNARGPEGAGLRAQITRNHFKVARMGAA